MFAVCYDLKSSTAGKCFHVLLSSVIFVRDCCNHDIEQADASSIVPRLG